MKSLSTSEATATPSATETFALLTSVQALTAQSGLSTTISDSTGNYHILKLDPFVTQWYVVPNQTGVRIAAYNEVSAAIVTASGLIYLSSDTGDSTNATYIISGIPQSQPLPQA